MALAALKEEHERVLKLYKSNVRSMDEIQEQLRSLSNEVTSLRGTIDGNAILLSRTQQNLEDTRTELLRAEKRLDRMQSPVAMSTLGNNVQSPAVPTTPGPPEAAAGVAQPKEEQVSVVE